MRRYTKPHSTPATPTMNDDTANASSLVRSTGTPMTRAASSLSRTAMKWWPVCVRTRRQASSVSTVTMLSEKR
ncbi:hypothetical protein D9M69_611590 [compost metagenome]